MARAGVRVLAVDLAIRAVRRASGAVRRASGYVESIASGIALGVLDPNHFHDLDRVYYDREAAYRDEGHVLGGLFEWERVAVDGWFGACRSLAVVGAGGGREVLALARPGVVVDGFECNERLIRVAAGFLAAQNCAERVRHLPRDTAPPPDRAYDGLIVGWGVYMLIPGRDRRIRFLRDMAALVPPGTPLLASFFTRRDNDRRAPRVARIGSAIRWLRRTAPVEEGDDLHPNYVHRFTEAEIHAEFAAGGFELVRYVPQGRTSSDSGWAVGLRR